MASQGRKTFSTPLLSRVELAAEAGDKRGVLPGRSGVEDCRRSFDPIWPLSDPRYGTVPIFQTFVASRATPCVL
jgi:hypothetical protein